MIVRRLIFTEISTVHLGLRGYLPFLGFDKMQKKKIKLP